MTTDSAGLGSGDLASGNLASGDLGGSGAPQGPPASGGPASPAPSGVSFEGNSATAGLVANAQSSDDDFLYGDDLAITNPPNWHSQRSTELYNGATMNNDPATAQGASQDWIVQADQLKDVADDLYRSITELGAAWVGQGSGAAQGALARIATSGSQAGSAARVMGDRMSRQAEAAAEVKKMPPPQEFDPEQALQASLAGGPAAMVADLKAQRDAAQAVKEEQVRYFNAYTAAMTDVDRSTPSFGPESIGLKPDAGSGVAAAGSVGGVGGPAPVGGRHAAPSTSPGYGPVGPAGSAVPGVGGQASPAGPAAGPAATPVSSGAAAHTASTGAAASAGASSAPMTAAAAPSASPAAPPASGSSAAALGGAALGGGLGLAGGRLAAGKQSGATRKEAGEPDEHAAYGEIDGADGVNGAAEFAGEVGGETTTRETDVAAQQSSTISPAGSSTAGAVSSSGPIGHSAAPMGAPMAGAAGANGGGSDEEHTHASYLIEADPDDIFGADQATPPPVIGEWVDDDES